VIRNVLAGIAVRDIGAAKGWYTAMIGREPDSAPMDGLFEWQFNGGAWLQLFVDAEKAGHSSATFVEDQIAGRADALAEAGIAIVSRSSGEGISLVIVNDPDGNQIVFAQGSDEKHRAVQ
jgi:hypothetical protein